METRSSACVGKGYVELIADEHRVVESLAAQYKSTTDVDAKSKLAHQIIKELSEHAAKEEMTLYPLMRSKLPNGAAVADHALHEHQQVKELLFQLDQSSPADPSFDAKLDACLSDVLQHVSEEENEMLPALDALLSVEERAHLTRSYVSAAGMAPSRPHPSAPNKGPMAMAANIAAKGMDAVRDTTRDFSGKPSM